MAHKHTKVDWLIITLLIFIPRLLNLNVFLTADEPLFLQHTRDFAAGIVQSDFSRTVGIGYPGVTVAGWAAPLINLAQTELDAYTLGRVATGLLSGLLLLLLFGLSCRLLGRWSALLGVGLLALDPYTLGYSRLFHIAAPLALLMTLAGVTLLLWLAEQQYRWLILTGMFTGLALLTKSTALLLGPMFAVLLFSWAVSTEQWRNKVWWGRQLGAVLTLVLVSCGVFIALWPAMWVDPLATLNLTFGKLFTDQAAGTGNLGLFWLGRFVEDPGPTFYPIAFLLKSTPTLLLGLTLSLISLIKNTTPHVPRVKCQVKNRDARHLTPDTRHVPRPTSHAPPPTSPALWLFALTYLLLMTIASKKSIRYMLPAFPTFYLIAGLAYTQTFNWVKNKISPSPHPSISNPPISLTITLLCLFTFIYHPYYLTYYNPLVLGWRVAPQTLLVGWGEGLDGAARYLNQQPAQRVSAWYEWLFSLQYQGEVQPVVPQENLITADKAVLYLNQVQRDIPSPNIIHYFRTRRQPEHTVRLNGLDYAWVYPGPIAGFGADPQPQNPVTGEFGGEARLLGYNLHPAPVSGSDSLIVTLYWRALVTSDLDRFVFLRLVDSGGHTWARADSPPVMGLWPTQQWQPDMLIEDAHALPLPPGMPPGKYQLEVGLYNPADGYPLAISGQPVGQGGGLLVGEVDIVWQSVDTPPELPHQTETQLAPDAYLTGYTKPPPTATTGDIFTAKLAWREDWAFLNSWLGIPNDFVLFEWRQNGQRVAEQLDPLPLPIAEWGRGGVLLAQHNIIVPPSLTDGQYELVLMLHTSSDPAGDVFSLGMVDVTAPPHHFDLPAGASDPIDPTSLIDLRGQQVTLSGYTLKTSPQALTTSLYWQTDAPLTNGYKVFVQLLAANNNVVTQSDSVPATDQRPTPGWLPGEIISDTHTLTLPADLPADTYRLITGLYNPVTSQRLSTAIGSDIITIAEVSLP